GTVTKASIVDTIIAVISMRLRLLTQSNSYFLAPVCPNSLTNNPPSIPIHFVRNL
ncbi:hypothetical protein PISMIDRAFT_687892, partial [Pisolithus microcarpus 441]